MNKRIYLFFSLIIYLTINVSSQICDTEPPSIEAQKEYFLNLPKIKNIRASSVNMVLAPLTVHVIRDASGIGGITLEELNTALDRLNEQFIPAGIRFYTCGINYIDNDNLNEFEKNDDRIEASTYLVENTFNLFIADTYTSNGSSSCGFAYYPNTSSWDMSVLKTSCVVNGTTLEHELGHAFNLRHTHQGSGSELVARPGSGNQYNCDTKGDGFCDTPADPNITGWSINGITCEVTNDKNETDVNGELFTPDSKNIMSYSPYKSCRSLFTSEQYAMMNYTAQNNADWTKMTCNSALYVDFDLSDIVAVAGQYITIDNQSTGEYISYIWTINGADISSSLDRDPVVLFSTPGNYDITLLATNASGFESRTKTIKVVALKSIPFEEDFTAGASTLDKYGTEINSESDLGVNVSSGRIGDGLYLIGANSNSPPYYVKAQSGEKPFLSNPRFNSSFVIPGLDARKFTALSLTFDAKQFYKYNPSYCNFRVLVNGESISSTYTIQSDGDEVWNQYTFDLSAYDRSIFSVSLEANTKYDVTGVNFDNINISGIEDTISFISNILSAETCEELEFIATGNAPVSNYSWDFGQNAVPAFALGAGPHKVTYKVMGDKTIILDGDQGSFIKTKINYISIATGVSHEPTLSISTNESLPVCSGTSIDFMALSENVGTANIDWFADEVKVGSGKTYTLSNITSELKVVAKVTSNDICSINQSEVVSNEIEVAVDICTGIDELGSNFTFYPNPTSGIIFMNIDNIESISVNNIIGSIALTKGNSNSVDISSFPNGVYIISVKTNNSVFVKKILKK